MNWIGETKCDICGKEIADTLIDGKTVFGPWAVMCQHCHEKYGVGFGLGRGQKYVSDGNGKFVKVLG